MIRSAKGKALAYCNMAAEKEQKKQKSVENFVEKSGSISGLTLFPFILTPFCPAAGVSPWAAAGSAAEKAKMYCDPQYIRL